MLLKASLSKHISIWITLITNVQTLSLSVVTDRAVVNVNSGFYLLNWFGSGLLLVLTVGFYPGCKHYKSPDCATFKTGSTKRAPSTGAVKQLFEVMSSFYL